MTAESFDAVLAEMRNSVWVDPDDLDRLQAAHEREVGELRTDLTDANLLAVQRADAAVALLQRWASTRHYADLALLDETDAFLAHGGQEKGES